MTASSHDRPRQCRKARQRAIPFDCKLDAGHPGNCTPYTHKPTGDYLRPSWLEMAAVEFDTDLAPTAKARRFVRSAPDTLFPRLLPETAPKPQRAAEQLEGQGDLFGGAS